MLQAPTMHEKINPFLFLWVLIFVLLLPTVSLSVQPDIDGFFGVQNGNALYNVSVIDTVPVDLNVVSAGPCKADGSDGILRVGDAYGLKVVVSITGTPAQPFRIKWTMANVTHYFENITAGPGNYWWYFVAGTSSLDDPIPWSVTVDPDGITGDGDPSNNYIAGTFTPVPPSSAVELYNTRLMRGTETDVLRFKSGSGTIGNIWVLYGAPTSHGAQTVIAAPGPINSTLVITPPNDMPLFEISRANIRAGDISDGQAFTSKLSSIRINPNILRQTTWNDMAAMTSEWTRWLSPDKMAQSDAPEITAFVKQSLPADYPASLTPYDTARRLHMAVMRKLTYKSPPAHGDAVNVLNDGVADCGGFSSLLVACLRNAGIPARRISGFYEGDSVWHVRVELHLPGSEWLVADPAAGNATDPTGSFAWHFGYVPDANKFFAVDAGDAHQMFYNNFAFLQVANWWWTGGATYLSEATQSHLTPVSDNKAPVLSAPSIEPVVAGADNEIIFSVNYMDPDGDPPAYIRVMVGRPDGTDLGLFDMTPDKKVTGNFKAGQAYKLSIGPNLHFSGGVFSVRFEAGDGIADPLVLDTYPSNGDKLHFTVDNTAPNAPTVSGTTPTINTKPTWTWTSGGGGNRTYQCRLDGGIWSVCTAPYIPSSALSEGAHTLNVQERDDADNWSVSGSKVIVVDITKPLLTLSTLSDNAWTHNATLNIAGQVTDQNGVGKLTVNTAELHLNPDGTFSYALSLAAGANRIATTATDNAGNRTTDTRTIYFDPNAPVLTITAPADNGVTKEGTILLTGSVDETAAVTARLNTYAPVTVPLTGNNFNMNIYLDFGLNTIEVIAEDKAQNATTTKRTVTFDNRNPSLSVTEPDADITTAQPRLLIKGTVTDLTIVTVAVTLGETVFYPIIKDGKFEQTVDFISEGTNTVTVTATDSAGNTATAQRNIIYIVVGDPDGNGTMNIVDALLVARHSAGLTVGIFYVEGADVNCDGTVNIVDALFIARKAAGLSVAGWCGY